MPPDETDAAGPPEAQQAARAAAEYSAVGYSEMSEADIVRLHAPVVKRLATRLMGRLPDTVQFDDLMQAGFIAVLRAVRGGSVTPDGVPPLLMQRIVTNAMVDEARRETWAPVRTVRLAKTAGRAMRITKQRLGRDGTDEEVAAAMNLGVRDYHSLLMEIAGIRMLDLDTFEEGEKQLRADDDQHAALDRDQLLRALTEAVAALPEREKTIVSLYYEHELNMEEVGRVLRVDKSTVCRAHGRALLRLRNALGDWGLDDWEAQQSNKRAPIAAPQQRSGE